MQISSPGDGMNAADAARPRRSSLHNPSAAGRILRTAKVSAGCPTRVQWRLVESDPSTCRQPPVTRKRRFVCYLLSPRCRRRSARSHSRELHMHILALCCERCDDGGGRAHLSTGSETGALRSWSQVGGPVMVRLRCAQVSRNFRAVTTCGQRHHKLNFCFHYFLSAGPKTT